ncbi:unnamed protein product, partial [Prorocentrum cordatum]
PPPPPCFNRDPGTNPSVGSVATRVRRVRARLTSALYTPTACGQRPLTQAGGGQGKFRTRLSGLAPPSGPNRRTTMHSYSADPRPSPAKGGQAMRAQAAQSNGTRGRRQARKRQERFNDDKNKKTQSVVTALGLASGPQEEGGGGGGGGEEMGGGRWRHGSDFAAEGGGGTGSSAPPARAARTATPPRWGAFRPPCLVSACACQPAGRSGRPPRPGRKAAADGGGDSASMPASSTIPPKLFHVGGEAEVLLQRPAIRGDGEANWPACSRGKKGASSKDAWAWIASRTGRQITPAWPGRRPRARRGPLARREPAAGDLGDAGEHRAEDAVQQACGERADGEGLEAEPAPPRGWRGPLQHHLGRTSRSRHAPPRGAARPGEGGGGTVRGAPAAA